jgi:NAD(P)-dependent dehydrogenase (short-subunit alcohol dehydrogenase family)
VVNNAGMNRPKAMTEVPVADFDAVVGLNLRSAFFLAQAAARRMIAAGSRGSLIHMSS